MARTRRRIILVAAALVLLVGGAFSGLLFETSPVVLGLTYNSVTQVSPCSSHTGKFYNTYGGGQFPDTGGNHGETVNPPVGEIFDNSLYWISNLPGGQSQTIVVGGFARSCLKGATFADRVYGHRYVFAIKNSESDGFKPFQNNDVPTADGLQFTDNIQPTVSLQSAVIHVSGLTYGPNGDQPIVDGAILKIDLWLKADDETWYDMASDQAQLRYTAPEGFFTGTRNGLNLYQVGDTFSFHWKIPTVYIGPPVNIQNPNPAPNAYALSIISENTGAALGDWDKKVLTTTTGVAEFPITADMFSSDLTKTNHIDVFIQGQVVNAFFSQTAVVDQAILSPRLISVKADKEFYHQGDQATVTVVGAPNAQTKLPLVKSTLTYTFNGESGGTLTSQSPTNNTDGTSTFTFTFTAGFTGLLKIDVDVFDSANRPAGVYEAQYLVDVPIQNPCVLYPQLQQCQTGSRIGWLLYVGIAGIVMILVGFFGKPLPFYVRVILIVVGGVFVVAFVLYWLIPAAVDFFKGLFGL